MATFEKRLNEKGDAMGDETRSLVDAEWEKFERGIVRPGGKPSGAMSDPEAAARMAFVCGFHAACLVVKETGGEMDDRVWLDSISAFDVERDEWRKRFARSWAKKFAPELN
jgi:hypothetical protein